MDRRGFLGRTIAGLAAIVGLGTPGRRAKGQPDLKAKGGFGCPKCGGSSYCFVSFRLGEADKFCFDCGHKEKVPGRLDDCCSYCGGNVFLIRVARLSPCASVYARTCQKCGLEYYPPFIQTINR